MSFSSFFSDFTGSLTDNAGLTHTSPPTDTPTADSTSTDVGAASGDSFGTQAGNLFYSILDKVANGQTVKQAITNRVAQTPTAQAYAAQAKSNYIRGILSNPMLWVALLIGVLVIGYAGFRWGKR